MSNSKPKLVLAELETLVMKEIWRRGKASVHDVRDALQSKRKLAYTTILTTLRNLERKGFLGHEQEGRSYVYIPAVQEREVERSALRNIIDGLFDGSRLRLVNALFEDENLTEEEYRKIKAAILESRKQEKKHE